MAIAVPTAARTFLDVPPRRRPSIPARDLAAGVAMGMGLCAVVLAITAAMESKPPPTPDEPLTVSIGVMATSEPGSGGGGAPGRAGKAGKRRGRKGATPTSSTSEPTTPQHHAPSSTSRVPAISVPSPTWETPAGLPGLGDLGDPAEGTEAGEGEGGTGAGEGNGDGGGGDGGGDGDGDGGLGAYRSQLAAWLASHFHVEGSGLGATALRKLRVRAVLELDDDRVVIDYQLTLTGTPAVDEAARRALEAVKGQPVPAPPAGLGSLQRRIHVVLTCRPDTCD